MADSDRELGYYYALWSNYTETARKREMRAIRKRATRPGQTWGQGGDPLGSLTPAAQNKCVQHLAQIAAGRIDDWTALLDPTLTFGENQQILLDNGGQLTEAQQREKEKDLVRTADDRERSHAAGVIRDLADEADNPAETDAYQDIAAEYGEDFAAAELAAAIDDAAAVADAPLASPDREPAAPTAAEPSIDRIEAQPVGEPRGVRVALDPDPVRIPATPTTPVAGDRGRDYTGITGTLRLFRDVIVAGYRAGKRDATGGAAEQAEITSY